MVVRLDETLDGLLEQIDYKSGPVSMDICTSTEQIADPVHPYSSLIVVDDILWSEFRDYFPDEFNKYIAGIAIKVADFVDFVETYISADDSFRDVVQYMKNMGLDKEVALKQAWMSHIGSTVNTLAQFSVEYGNNNNPAKPVNLSRYYGNTGVVYQIGHQDEGGNFRAVGIQFLQNPELLIGHPNRLLKGVFEMEHYTIAFGKNGKEVYLMYRTNNPGK